MMVGAVDAEVTVRVTTRLVTLPAGVAMASRPKATEVRKMRMLASLWHPSFQTIAVTEDGENAKPVFGLQVQFRTNARDVHVECACSKGRSGPKGGSWISTSTNPSSIAAIASR